MGTEKIPVVEHNRFQLAHIVRNVGYRAVDLTRISGDYREKKRVKIFFGRNFERDSKRE